MMTKKELLNHLTLAPKPNRLLDAELERLSLPVEVNGISVIEWVQNDEWFDCITADGCRHYEWRWIRRFTKSLDAALTLVPVRHHVWLDIRADHNLPEARVYTDALVCDIAIGATPAISLCIAALLARDE